MIAAAVTTVLADGALAQQTMVSTSTGEAVQFWILGTLAVISALGVVAAPKAVYSALFLAMTMIILAVFYMVQGALFLGVVQIVVYTGAVMMLFLFVLMLVGVDSSDSLVESLRGQRVSAIVIGLGFGLLLIGGLGNASISGFTGFTGLEQGNIEALADLIFIRYVWAFELTGALLITATLGAMMLAHREKIEAAMNQRELSKHRFKYLSSDEDSPEKGSATPLPSPGVYARHNAVDMPARLPDGSHSDISVSSALTPRRPSQHLGEENDR
ncbi:NADH-quinone oxidoreductase subunit J [Rhodococcus sp. ARC_M6]|uniref:NADH-quinone oxidoreductase subunit J n=1 Tax=Rhodococcus sp. ARC_M6 TaxID=2928852 RepID=UPI002436BE00|nr:NADH-quinone oxidoreductase subunit J [Rhodococcus sp. ARC_M6]